MAAVHAPGDLASFPTHPAHLAAVAVICGLPTPPIAGGRVLELACGSGFNLLAMSRSLPDARFVGFDCDENAIRRGREIAAETGATNVELHVGRFGDFDSSLGQFDFIVVRGLFSHLPPDGQSALLQWILDRLTPNGLACVGYNTLPGWSPRGILRDALRGLGIVDVPAARAAARQLVDTLADPESPSALALKAEWRVLDGLPDESVRTEYLAETNRPILFGDFARMLADGGLQYVAESHYGTSSFAQLGSDRRALDPAGSDLLRREQYLDFRLNRSSRLSIVCRAEREIPRAPNPVDTAKLWLSPRVQLVEPLADPDATDFDEAVREEDGAGLQIHDPLYRHLLRRLRRAPGRRLPVAAFREDVNEIVGFDVGDEKAMNLLMQVAHKGTIEEVWHPYAAETQYVDEPGERPRACPIVRRQAEGGSRVTNRLHRTVSLTESERALLSRLDGTATRDELARGFAIDHSEVDAILARLAAAAVIEA